MNSPFSNLFTAISSHLQQQVPALKYIDQDLGQLSQGRPPVSWPCVLIDVADFAFAQLGGNVQTANGNITITLGFAAHSGTALNTPAGFSKMALGYYELEWLVNQALHGWRPAPQFGCLARTSAVTRKKTGGYRIREINYSIAFEDYSAVPQQQMVPATAIIETLIG